MKYPSIYLLGPRAHGEVLSIAFAGAGQHQDARAKIIHAAPSTTSNIFAKSICKDGGRGSYRGLLEIAKGAHGSRSKVVCDALLLDDHVTAGTSSIRGWGIDWRTRARGGKFMRINLTSALWIDRRERARPIVPASPAVERTWPESRRVKADWRQRDPVHRHAGIISERERSIREV